MNHDTLSLLRNELAYAAANLKKCQSAYRGLKAFKDNRQGLAFCAYQLLQEAAGLRERAEQVAALAAGLHSTFRDRTDPEETADSDGLGERRHRNGVEA